MKLTIRKVMNTSSLMTKMWICARFEDHIYYQVRPGERARWVTRDEWFCELKQKMNMSMVKHDQKILTQEGRTVKK